MPIASKLITFDPHICHIEFFLLLAQHGASGYSIGQLSENYMLHEAGITFFTSYRKNLTSGQSQPDGCTTIGTHMQTNSRLKSNRVLPGTSA